MESEIKRDIIWLKKEVRCPNCGKTVTSFGEPGEVKKVACPSCFSEGKVTFEKTNDISEVAIDVNNLRKEYGELVAVNNISFSVSKGVVFAFLGPNGAGKTTTVEMIENIRQPTEGEIKLLGKDIKVSFDDIKEKIGILPQEFHSFERLTVRETLDFFSKLYKKRASIDGIIEAMDLKDEENRLYMNLSGGLKQRVGVAISLVNDPDIIFLDEPTTGLDPKARREVWEVIANLRDKGKTVFLTTHYMEEAEYLADHIAIIHKGNIIAEGTLDELIHKYGEGSILLIKDCKTKEVIQILKDRDFNAYKEGNRDIAVKIDHKDRVLEILSILRHECAEYDSIDIRGSNLEEVFLHLTGSKLSEETKMRPGIILASFKSDIKSFVRSKGTLFWTLAFPVMLILIFGAIFSGADDAEYELYVIDYDDTEMSNLTINILEGTGIIKAKIVDVSEDKILSYIKENGIKRLIVIPEGYQDTIGIVQMGIDEEATTNISFYFDQSEQQTNSIVRSVVSSVVINLNMNVSGGKEIIHVNDIETISGEFGFIDFFLPGMIGFTIMQTCVYGSLERNTKFRKDGILRKLLTTPITRSEWIFSKMLFQLFLSFVSALLIIIVGIIVYGMNVHITFFMIILVIATSFLFTGIGMLIGRFVKDEESAAMAGGAITFPMMFLAGTFFPLEQMPGFLQTFARFMPLYYVNEGLRNAMIYLKTDDTIFHTVIVLIFASVFFISGLLFTKWKED